MILQVSKYTFALLWKCIFKLLSYFFSYFLPSFHQTLLFFLSGLILSLLRKTEFVSMWKQSLPVASENLHAKADLK